MKTYDFRRQECTDTRRVAYWTPGEDHRSADLPPDGEYVPAEVARGLYKAARMMVNAKDNPQNGEDGGAEESARAWMELRAALSLARGEES